MSSLQLRVRIAQAGQVSGARPGVEIGQQAVVQLFGFHFRHAAVGIVGVAEHDGLGGARGLAGRLDFAFPHGAPFLFGLDLGVIDALYAVGALFHDAPAAHRHVRVVQQLETGRLVIGEQVEVEPPYFVRAVVRAVARAHAAVVDHVIQAFRTVVGGLHRADQLAGRVLALHAGHRLVVNLGIVEAAVVVAVDTQPVHGPAAAHLVFAHHGDIVFRLASHDAGAASRAGVEVDRHAPGIAFVLPLGIHGEAARRSFGAGTDR